MAINNFEVKIKLEILGANIVIEDADIAFECEKSTKSDFNTATIELYNIADTTYNLIKDKANYVRVFLKCLYTDDYVLIFQGNLRQTKKRRKAKPQSKYTKKGKLRKVKSATPHYNEPVIRQEGDGADIATVIELEDGKNDFFLKGGYKNSYSGQITLQKIVDDLITQCKGRGLPIGRVDKVNDKIYPKGQVVFGDLLSLLNKYCAVGGCRVSVQNNVLTIVKDGAKSDDYCILLDGSYCTKPEEDTENKINLEGPLMPSLNPENYVKCDFKVIKGFYPVSKVKHIVDTFGENFTTQIELQAPVPAK